MKTYQELVDLLEAIHFTSTHNVLNELGTGIPNIQILCLSSRKEQALVIEYTKLIGAYSSLTHEFIGDFGYLYLFYTPAKQYVSPAEFLHSKKTSTKTINWLKRIINHFK